MAIFFRKRTTKYAHVWSCWSTRSGDGELLTILLFDGEW